MARPGTAPVGGSEAGAYLQVTFSKRRNGLLKKALELSILCKCDIAVVILPSGNKSLHQWTNLPSMEEALAKYKTVKHATGVRVQVEVRSWKHACESQAVTDPHRLLQR